MNSLECDPTSERATVRWCSVRKLMHDEEAGSKAAKGKRVQQLGRRWEWMSCALRRRSFCCGVGERAAVAYELRYSTARCCCCCSESTRDGEQRVAAGQEAPWSAFGVPLCLLFLDRCTQSDLGSSEFYLYRLKALLSSL